MSVRGSPLTRAWRCGAAAVALGGLLLAGCATPPPASAPVQATAVSAWSGRMALQVEGDATRSFSASFELRGDARSGEFTLLSPFGNTVARLLWQPGTARLEANGENRSAASVDALVALSTGTAIPVSALFDWLAGLPTAVPGWEPDLSLLPHGRLAARRVTPPPAVDLRVAFEN